MGFATSKAHKGETQGKYFDLLFFSKDHIKIFSEDFKIFAIIRMKIFAENSGEENFPLFQSQAPSEIWRKSLEKIEVKI